MNAWILACSTCAQNFVDHGKNPAGYSILFLLAIILPVLAGVTFFMFRLIRRGEQSLDPELQDDPI